MNVLHYTDDKFYTEQKKNVRKLKTYSILSLNRFRISFYSSYFNYKCDINTDDV